MRAEGRYGGADCARGSRRASAEEGEGSVFLEEILRSTRATVEERRRRRPLNELKRGLSGEEGGRYRSLHGALTGNRTRGRGRVALIAEIKRASPSRGELVREFDPAERARDYAASGAAAISVLTEERYFRGSLEHLASVRREVRLPLLRKDFIIDPYQLHEARLAGADAVLLIVAALEGDGLSEMMEAAIGLGLEVLAEVHNRDELRRVLRATEAVPGGERRVIFGINNRDLRTFRVDLATTERLRPLIPEGYTVVSESGVTGRHDVLRLEGLGVDGILVGERLMRARDTRRAVRSLIGEAGKSANPG